MAFVKLDTGILDSTLWLQKDQRDVFLTGLLMAVPKEFVEPTPQLEVDTLNETGFVAPAGWYGFIPASGVGIIRRAMIEHEGGMQALRELGSPELESRSQEHEGRRMIRINGGYIVLNYMRFRDHDYGAADRMKRLRERKKKDNVHRNSVTVHPNVTHSREQRADTDTDTDTEEKLPVECNGIVFPESVTQDCWDGFVEMRKKNKWPLTDKAVSLIVGKLQNIEAGGGDTNAALDQSVERCYRGVFEVKNNGGGNGISRAQSKQNTTIASLNSFLNGEIRATDRSGTSQNSGSDGRRIEPGTSCIDGSRATRYPPPPTG